MEQLASIDLLRQADSIFRLHQALQLFLLSKGVRTLRQGINTELLPSLG